MPEARRKCPTDENGLPVIPEGFNECYDVCLRGIMERNRHHLVFPRVEHKTKPARDYRQTAAMIVQACICKHADYHATYLPPQPPSVHMMYDVVQGDVVPSVGEVFIRSRNQSNVEAVVD